MKILYLAVLLSFIGLTTTYAQVKSATPAFYVDSGIVMWDYHSKLLMKTILFMSMCRTAMTPLRPVTQVLYLTDGDWNERTAMDCLDMLDQDYETIAPIIVGIGYGSGPDRRTKDLDPATGGPNFMAFIAQELMPFIKSKYRVNGDNALYGYSYGGMFATSALFDHPGLLTRFLSARPVTAAATWYPPRKSISPFKASLKPKFLSAWVRMKLKL